MSSPTPPSKHDAEAVLDLVCHLAELLLAGATKAPAMWSGTSSTSPRPTGTRSGVFSIGVMLAFSMRPEDLPWAAAMVFGTYGVLRLGTNAFGETTGTFLAAAAVTVATGLLGRSLHRPPTFVMFLVVP